MSFSLSSSLLSFLPSSLFFPLFPFLFLSSFLFRLPPFPFIFSFPSFQGVASYVKVNNLVRKIKLWITQLGGGIGELGTENYAQLHSLGNCIEQIFIRVNFWDFHLRFFTFHSDLVYSGKLLLGLNKVSRTNHPPHPPQFLVSSP